jgi:uncharacterized protein DUF6232
MEYLTGAIVNQELLYASKNVNITSTAAHFGNTTYQIANIGSVTIVDKRRLRGIAIALFLIGLALATQMNANQNMGAVGIGGLILSIIVQMVWPVRESTLVLKTSSGDIQAITSRDREYVDELKGAIEQAFAMRMDRTTTR